jgi:hypothetical protein
MEMAIEYYTCYAKGAGFYKTVTAENSSSCPNAAAQYYERLVKGIDRMLLIGAERFSGDAAITGLEAGAQETASTGAFSTVPFCSANGATSCDGAGFFQPTIQPTN